MLVRPALATRLPARLLRPLTVQRNLAHGDDLYLQRSPVPSSHFQSSLPRLPVPKLDDTLDRYLRALEPLIAPDVLATHSKVVADFKGGDGNRLQAKLVAFDKANKHTSYISAAWFDMYLKSRTPLPVNFNAYIGLEMDKDPSKNNQLDRASVLISSSVRFANSLRANLLKPDMYHMDPKLSTDEAFLRRAGWVPGPLRWLYAYAQKAFPLDMSQYGRLFNSTRIPKVGRDELVTDSSGRHVAVLRRGRIYTFDVLRADGSAVAIDEIKAHLQGIINADAPASLHPVGVLTTMERDAWATVRGEMERDAVSSASLKLIDSALFTVALDDTAADSEAELSRQMLSGDGRNRWFDKSFTLIVLPNGMAGVNFEHAWGDGVAVLRYVNEVCFSGAQTWADGNAIPRPSEPTAAIPPREVAFNLTPALQARIDEAAAKFDSSVEGLCFELKRVGPMGRKQLKSAGVGPDGACQFAFQLGYYRLFGQSASTYESCSTAAFKHGRTETIRPNTSETLAATRAFCDPNATVEEKLAKFLAANKMHNTLTKNAAMGQGFDRHMFMLKHLAQEDGSVPLLFTDQGCYDKLGHIILSTSTLQSPAIMTGGFGPVARDGFGVGYSLTENELGLHITDYGGRAKDLLASIEGAWSDIWDVLQYKVKKSAAPPA